VLAGGEERAVESGVLVAGVEDPAGAGRDRGLDTDAVQGHPVGARIVRGDEKHLLGALERVEQRRRVVIAATPDADPAIGEVLRLRDVPHAHPDLIRGDALEQVLDGGAVEGAGGAGDDDHVLPSLALPVICQGRYQGKRSVSKLLLSSIT
jgi:hypothetical protein